MNMSADVKKLLTNVSNHICDKTSAARCKDRVGTQVVLILNQIAFKGGSISNSKYSPI